MAVACVAAGPRTRLNHLYSPTEGLERLRRRLKWQKLSAIFSNFSPAKLPLVDLRDGPLENLWVWGWGRSTKKNIRAREN